jgi:hypothetical protein
MHGYATHVRDAKWIFKIAKPNVAVDLILPAGERIEIDPDFAGRSVIRRLDGVALPVPCVEDMSQAVSPARGEESLPVMPRQIDIHELQSLMERGAQVVEVLPANEFEEEHLPGARNIPLKRLGAATIADLDRRAPVVVYCWDSQ